ncbi:MAG: hypothetical protein KF794_08110 [Xanthobacteraceae bacterium]|nr:hypothetical protein [Xanthobacteraceae bacterium]QYK43777.1 MAG: hypothetical protein KF794_08110 [Xanthobacteraceae bacterium]
MAYDPNDPRNRNFEYDQFSQRTVDPAPAGFSTLIIGAIVVLGALIAFLMFRTEPDATQVGMNTPPVTQERQTLPPTNTTPPAPPANTPAPAPAPAAPPADN